MASKKINFTVGLFVAGGMSLAVVAIVWLGMARFFEKGQYYVTYFNESVQGLEQDAPVKYRGVPVGRVERIGVAPDSKLIELVLKIESGRKHPEEYVAQLKSVGITGSMFVELDRKKKGEAARSPALGFPSKYPVIASKPSEISALLQGIDDVLRQIKAMDLPGVSQKIKQSLDSLNQGLVDADIRGTSEGIRRLIGKADSSISSLETIIANNQKDLNYAIVSFGRAMEQANVFLGQGTGLVNDADESFAQLRRHITAVAQNLERASLNMNLLLERLADHPSQLLFGEPPKAKPFER